MDKNPGFTLAEILITLSIIGMVAAMTIPAMVQDIQDQQFRTAWKKTYADLAQAARRLRTDYGENLSGSFNGAGNDHDNFRNKFLPYLNYTKLCNQFSPTGPNGCWHNSTSWYKLSGPAYNSDWYWSSRIVLTNGVLVLFNLISLTCTGDGTPNDDNCGSILVDVNGFTSPNKVGKDIFGLWLLKDGRIFPFGTQGDDMFNMPDLDGCDVKNHVNTYGWNCSADYLYQ